MNWIEEIAHKGTYYTLKSRLSFHKTVLLKEAVKQTSLSKQTIIKHMRQLVKDGYALRGDVFGEVCWTWKKNSGPLCVECRSRPAEAGSGICYDCSIRLTTK